LHGLTGSPDELLPLTGALSAAGRVVHAPLLAGHGRDVAALAPTKWTDWLASADDALTAATVSGPAAIVASSAGGLLALHLAATRPRDVSGLVLLATPTSLSRVTIAQIRLRLLVPEAIRPASWNVIMKPHGPDVSDRTQAAGLRSLPAYPLRTLGQLLDMMADARARVHQVTQPVLVVHGDLDSVVSRAQVDALAASLDHAARVERLDLPASAHLVGIDRDRVLLQQQVVRFLDTL
jgi:carboxylesterase